MGFSFLSSVQLAEALRHPPELRQHPDRLLRAYEALDDEVATVPIRRDHLIETDRVPGLHVLGVRQELVGREPSQGDLASVEVPDVLDLLRLPRARFGEGLQSPVAPGRMELPMI
jgi:hypothetical protein